MESTKEKILLTTSQLISVVFHPLFIPLYATWLLFHSNNYLSYAVSPKLQDFLYILIFTITYLVPAVVTWLLWQKGWVKSFELEDKKDRTLPFFLTLCCYIAGIYLLFNLPIPRVFGFTLLGAGIGLLAALIINFKWKISIHMIGLGGLLGLFYGFGRYFHLPTLAFIVLIAIISGIVGAARLYKGGHSPAQIYVGFIVGFLLEMGFVYFFAPFFIG